MLNKYSYLEKHCRNSRFQIILGFAFLLLITYLTGKSMEYFYKKYPIRFVFEMPNELPKEISKKFGVPSKVTAEKVYLVGDFNNWGLQNIPGYEMKMAGPNRWVLDILLPDWNEGHTYKYRFIPTNAKVTKGLEGKGFVWVWDMNAVLVPDGYGGYNSLLVIHPPILYKISGLLNSFLPIVLLAILIILFIRKANEDTKNISSKSRTIEVVWIVSQTFLISVCYFSSLITNLNWSIWINDLLRDFFIYIILPFLTLVLPSIMLVLSLIAYNKGLSKRKTYSYLFIGFWSIVSLPLLFTLGAFRLNYIQVQIYPQILVIYFYILIGYVYLVFHRRISITIKNKPYIVLAVSVVGIITSYIAILSYYGTQPFWEYPHFNTRAFHQTIIRWMTIGMQPANPMNIANIKLIPAYFFDNIVFPLLTNYGVPWWLGLNDFYWIFSGFFIIAFLDFMFIKAQLNRHLYIKSALLISLCILAISYFALPLGQYIERIKYTNNLANSSSHILDEIILRYFIIKKSKSRSDMISNQIFDDRKFIEKLNSLCHLGLYKIIDDKKDGKLMVEPILSEDNVLHDIFMQDYHMRFKDLTHEYNVDNVLTILGEDYAPVLRELQNGSLGHYYTPKSLILGRTYLYLVGDILILIGPRVLSAPPPSPISVGDDGIPTPLEFTGRFQSSDFRNLMAIEFIILSSGVIALIFFLLRPISKLKFATERVKSGDYEVQVPVDRADELGQLAHSFNEMVYGLKMKEFIKSTFDRYVSHEVAEKILENPESVRPVSEKRNISVMFADIRSFTIYAESHTPEKVAGTLNEFFETMVETAFEFEGTVDKFIGDCIMIVFGAPLNQPDHPERAVKCALAMKNALVQLNGVRENRGEKPINIGIGINSGEAMVGSVGATRRLEFSVIGDCVNLAARLEDLAVEGQILIGPGTYDKVRDIVKVKSLPPQSVKGKSKPVELYEVISMNLKSS